jgi:Mg-chelatase subunit ChlD
MKFTPATCALAAFLACSMSLSGQSEPCSRRTLAINVFDNEGHAVAGIARENLQAWFHHEPVRILSVTANNTPRIVIVFDTSGSMLGEKSEWDFAIATTRELVASVSAGTQIGLIFFSTGVEKSVPLTSDLPSVARELDALAASRRGLMKGIRKTALWDALEQGRSLFGSPAAGDSFYVVSDGMENASRSHASDFDRYASTVRVFAFVPETMPNATPIDGMGTDLLGLASESGGSTLVVSTEPLEERDSGPLPVAPDSFDTVLRGNQIHAPERAQFQKIASYYRVEIELEHPLDKKSDWTLKAGIKNRSRSYGLNVAYPKRLWPRATQNVISNALP